MQLFLLLYHTHNINDILYFSRISAIGIKWVRSVPQQNAWMSPPKIHGRICIYLTNLPVMHDKHARRSLAHTDHCTLQCMYWMRICTYQTIVNINEGEWQHECNSCRTATSQICHGIIPDVPTEIVQPALLDIFSPSVHQLLDLIIQS